MRFFFVFLCFDTDESFQFQIEPHSMEKPIKLQLPIMLATYPLRGDDGTLRRKRGAHYPSTLPIFRPWLDEKTFDWRPRPLGILLPTQQREEEEEEYE